jgi:uncharacterized membrane protein
MQLQQLEKANTTMALRALGVGLIDGMRSWTPMAALAFTYNTAPSDAAWRRWPLFSSKAARLVWLFFGVNEYVADKWPRTIPRIGLVPQPTHTDGGIIGRTLFGTLTAAALGTEYKEENSVAASAAIGTVASLAANYFFYYVRKALKDKTKVHDYTVAMIEDQLCFALAVAVARSA